MRRHVASRSAVTLVELLVTMTIIAILMALLTPAIRKARALTRQSYCAGRLHTLALAAIDYEVTRQRYPGYLETFGSWDPAGAVAMRPVSRSSVSSQASSSTPSGPSAGGLGPCDPLNSIDLPHEKLGTWAVSLLPHLNAQAAYEIWTEDRYPLLTNHQPTPDHYNPLAVPNLEAFQCPSDSSDGDEQYGRNSYVSNNGYVDPSGGASPRQFADSMKRANGIFNNKYRGRNRLHNLGTTPVGPDVRADDIRDGLGNTIMFSEDLQADRWYRVGLRGRETEALIKPALHLDASLARVYQGMVWRWYDHSSAGSAPPPPAEALINGRSGKPDNGSYDDARPSSAHPTGVNAAFADGGVRFISETIDYRVYQALLTPHGKASDVPMPEYVLDPDAI